MVGTNGANVFCRLYPSPTPSHHGSVWVLPVIFLLITNTVSPVRACYPYDGRGFVGTKKKTIVGLLVFITLWSGPNQSVYLHLCWPISYSWRYVIRKKSKSQHFLCTVNPLRGRLNEPTLTMSWRILRNCTVYSVLYKYIQKPCSHILQFFFLSHTKISTRELEQICVLPHLASTKLPHEFYLLYIFHKVFIAKTIFGSSPAAISTSKRLLGFDLITKFFWLRRGLPYFRGKK